MKDIELAAAPLSELWHRLSSRRASADAVFATLREAILSQVLRPGQHYVEEDFAQLFGVSRTPVREAILRLESEGLLERRSRKGVMVSDISPAEVLEVYDVRVVLDALAAELSANRVPAHEIARLHWLNGRMQAAGEAGDFAEMSRLNLEFHEGLATASGSSFLLLQIRMVHDRVRRFEGSTFAAEGRWQQAVREHRDILAALEARDAEAAREATRRHMLEAKRTRLRMLEEATSAAG